jgi:DNA primase
MKIRPENLPTAVIDRLQELSTRYPDAEIELHPDTTELTDTDIEEIEGFIRLDSGEGVDFDDVIKKARAIVARKIAEGR